MLVSDRTATCAPRLGAICTSPSAASTRNASRSGVRDTPSRSPSARSFRRAPGRNSPWMMRSRSCSATVPGSVPLATGRTARGASGCAASTESE
ncbi:Uncharacterised protein [Bordetella ansorpii]|uniref:Uncharacterized protein n=1 Tax=Bordetella ansorpii TaxID=288768 RepID=A0A157SDA9_9BORD|nr:Uncharacterised protein [Bordetella ansorpii]